jgi:polysaccharide export outer membrane protein
VHRSFAVLVLALVPVLFAGCSTLIPGAGPNRRAIDEAEGAPAGSAVIQIVDVDDAVTRKLLAQRSTLRFSEVLGEPPPAPGSRRVGRGDLIEVTIWEAAPATLFGSAIMDVRGAPSTSHFLTLPEQMISSEGFITVPFAGRVPAGGRTLEDIEAEIVSRLKGKANQPEVLVRLTRNISSTATVVGEVTTSVRMPLTPGGERLLDALAAANGVRQPVNKMTIQVTRGSVVQSMPLQSIIVDPRQNIPLLPGDVVTAYFQPLSFTALGATGKNEEIPFETQGITLAQALARSGGLVDARSNPQGVFIFRFEPVGALEWPRQPAATTPEGMVPVIYRVNLLDPASFFVVQSFQIKDRDILYVSNAPVADVQKFLNLVMSVAYPVLNVIQVTQ